MLLVNYLFLKMGNKVVDALVLTSWTNLFFEVCFFNIFKEILSGEACSAKSIWSQQHATFSVYS